MPRAPRPRWRASFHSDTPSTPSAGHTAGVPVRRIDRTVTSSELFSPPRWVKPKKRPMLLIQNHSIKSSGEVRQKITGQISSHGEATSSDTR